MGLSGGNKGGGRRAGGTGVTSQRALSRMKINAAKFNELTQFIAEGLFEAGRSIIEIASANAPDSPYDPYPTGEGLPKQGGVLAYIGNQKVNGWSIRGDQPKKPRSLRLVTKQHSVVVAAGFGFPGRFAEGGTIKQAPQPFLGPAFDRVGAQGVINIVGDVARPKINGAR